MPLHWALRWLAMLLIFVASTLAFSSYAGASSPPTLAQTSASPGEPLLATDDQPASEEPQPVVTEPAEDRPPGFMWIITRSALLGAALGALVGTSIYFLTGRQMPARNIIYIASGGVLVGTAVGAIEVVVRESSNYGSAFLEGLPEHMQETQLRPQTIPVFRILF